ncbi:MULTISPECIES: lipopolysaccharide heptosyltransferase II [Methylomicrobium]|uniref:lipopolysaccharide heptosyltransferase II n=1 Tax=Methylomicrobium album BG8 TaxID=686340 RepID=H8GIH0_METAL|nr:MULTISPECIES: lipopolysaccharide heptosyltransferase II [Methylomicrobium]EIC31482.1 lipopolysaccharide heptosyltransferase II [Methylomicrobium album BG8]
MKPDAAFAITKKILVVGPSWVGDMVMAQSLFIALKAADPACRIDVLAPAWTFPLLDRMPEVARPIAMPLSHGQFGLAERIKLGRQLRSEAYDRAIVLPNSWKSALAPFFAHIPLRSGYIGECRWGLLNDARRLDKQTLTMTVQRFVALAFPKNAVQPPVYPVPAIPVEPARQAAAAEKFRVETGGNILALCPGAEYGPAKRWPSGHFAELARLKIADGWQVWLFGSEKDQAVTAEINRLAGGACIDFAGRTQLDEAVDLLSLAHAVVSNDSGLMHLAAALDKPLIAIYGSSDPGFTPPLHAKARIVSLHLDCAPCFKRICPLYPAGHPEHARCLSGIGPERILALLPG